MGLYQFRVMPFGLHSSGSTFQRLLDAVIGPELEPKAFAYFDDLVLVTKTFEEHLELLRDVFGRLREAGLRLNPKKCHFCKTQLKYLGHIVSDIGIATDPEKVKAIQEFPTPRNVKSLRSFLGLASWYRRFVDKFATVSRPLTKLLKKDLRWFWNPEQEAAFKELKRLLSSTPVLTCPDFSQQFVLQVDASNEGLGAVLTQDRTGREKVIAYASRLLSDQERNYTTTEKECLALVWAVRKFRPYLEGYRFIAITDHVALRWLMRLQEPSGRLARWIMDLQQYDFTIEYRKGTLNKVADALSRQVARKDDAVVPVGIAEIVREGLAREEEPEVPAEVDDDDASWYERTLELVRKSPGRHSNYCIRDGTLYRRLGKSRDGESSRWKMCVPAARRAEVMVENHDSPTAGHLGVKKTLSRVSENYFWPGWRRFVKNYVRSCHSCQQFKVAQQKPAGIMYFRNPRGPWHTVSADLMGPFPRSKSGHTFLLVFLDTFSKWVEMRPIRSATAKTVSEHFKSMILLRYGAPEVVLTDNGTQFTARLFRDLAVEWGVKSRYTAPYSPQSNPVERPNRVIKTMIAQFVKDNHRTWDALIGEFQYAINTAVHESTGFTPAKLCFGRELKPSRAIRGPLFETGTEPEGGTRADHPLEEIHGERELAFKRLYEKCQRNLKNAFARQSKYYNLRRREIQYAPGDQVWRRLHVLSNAAEAVVGKLSPKFQGPCEVLRRTATNMYEVRDVASNETHIVHVKDLKPLRTPTDPSTC